MLKSDIFDQQSAHYFNPKIEGLIHKAFEGAWAPDTAIHWGQEPVLPSGVDSATYIDLVSQLYHSEVLTIHVCARVIQEAEDFQAKQFLCTQLADEARHAQVYASYIRKLGPMAPIDPGLAHIYRGALEWRGSALALITAINVVLEGEALLQQRKRVETLPCPLFKEINMLIMRDESRHAAFGILYLQDKLKDAPQSEKDEILTWIASLWKGWEQANSGRYAGGESLQGLRTTQQELGERYAEQMMRFQKIGLLPKGVVNEVANGAP